MYIRLLSSATQGGEGHTTAAACKFEVAVGGLDAMSAVRQSFFCWAARGLDTMLAVCLLNVFLGDERVGRDVCGSSVKNVAEWQEGWMRWMLAAAVHQS